MTEGDAMLIAMLLAGAAPVQTQAAMTAEAGAAYRAADAAMNVEYRKLMALMAAADRVRDADLAKGVEKPDGDPTYRAALLAAQRSWLAFRDADCKVAGFEFRGGSAQGMALGQCLAVVTGARTAELRQQAQSMTPK